MAWRTLVCGKASPSNMFRLSEIAAGFLSNVLALHVFRLVPARNPTFLRTGSSRPPGTEFNFFGAVLSEMGRIGPLPLSTLTPRVSLRSVP